MRCSLFVIVTLALCLPTLPAPADERPTPSPPPTAEQSVDRGLALIDLILEHHVDPPTFHEMVLGGAKELLSFSVAEPNPTIGLSRRVSKLSSREDLRSFLIDAYREAADGMAVRVRNGPPRSQPPDGIESILVRGILNVVPGEPFMLPAEQYQVVEQAGANRYVGIGIVPGIDKDSKLLQIKETIRRGSAHRGGAKTAT